MTRRSLLGGLFLVLTACGATSTEAKPTVAADAPEQNAAKPRSRFVCREYDRGTSAFKSRTVVLQQMDDLGLTEGKKLTFEAELYEGANVLPARTEKGQAETEDVNFAFTSESGAFKFHTFFDELEESGLQLDGKDAGDFVCFTGHLVCSDYDRSTETLKQQTVVLSQRGTAPIVEGRKIPFDLERFESAKMFAGQTSEGTVETEDVMFVFTSNDTKTVFNVFLDELSESGLTIEGKDRGDFICR